MKNIVLVGTGKGIGNETLKLLSGKYNITSLSRSKFDFSHNENTKHYEFDTLKDDFSSIEFPEEIHGLVYFPGSINLKPFNRLTLDDFKNDFEINVLGAIKTIQFLLPNLKKSHDSSIVLFSTVAAKIGMPFHASVAAAKSAVEGLVKSFAAEYSSQNIRCNAIAPSLTDTSLAQGLLSTETKKTSAAERHPLKRIGDPKEMAEIVGFLLSPGSSWMTGQIIGIDGGMSSLKL
ncbi:SDR family oxidoreductase [Chryseobacterium chendengshani]|uniref:SDR family NAD(P)-dependent oxidoreductase n=1 Tax=Chryseobacterium sp. LJ668 TaxID=2864040 RepID=UPI001C68F025|nr:SDR family oxidoreductase [Chryseobacterium sp. LJ668]MBW8523873.1 SDR family oxidoreductase [Chryseobacterium sp. LJ668]QYK16814.1 SDR family oxidoreductase [Chryseobacterium sp. LJ668]